MTTSSVDSKPRGRPRSEDVDHAIVEAVLDTLADQGIAGISMEGIAQRALISKSALYRRYANKDAMIVTAVERIREQVSAVPQEGSAYQRLLLLMQRTRDSLPHSRNGRIMLVALAQSAHQPDLARLVYERVLVPRRAKLREIITEGISSGEFPAHIDIDVVMPTLVGPMLYLGMWSMCEPVQQTSTEAVLRAALGLRGP